MVFTNADAALRSILTQYFLRNPAQAYGLVTGAFTEPDYNERHPQDLACDAANLSADSSGVKRELLLACEAAFCELAAQYDCDQRIGEWQDEEARNAAPSRRTGWQGVL